MGWLLKWKIIMIILLIVSPPWMAHNMYVSFRIGMKNDQIFAASNLTTIVIQKFQTWQKYIAKNEKMFKKIFLHDTPDQSYIFCYSCSNQMQWNSDLLLVWARADYGAPVGIQLLTRYFLDSKCKVKTNCTLLVKGGCMCPFSPKKVMIWYI